MITGRRFSRLHPKAASAVFCKDGFGDGYHLVIRVDLGWAKTLCRKGFRLFGGHSHSSLMPLYICVFYGYTRDFLFLQA